MRTKLCQALAAVVLTALLAEPSAAKGRVPIKGVIQALETSVAVFPPEVPFPTLIVDARGSGLATHLGRFSVTYEFEVDLTTFFGVGFAEFKAANGDRLYTDIEGQGTVPTADGISFICETHIITGGSGRFAGARGSMFLFRVINVFTGVTMGSFQGTLLK